MIRSCVLSVALGAAVVSSASAQETKTITIVADEWPPFSGTELPEFGMSLHVISAVLTEAGYDVKPSVLPWARIMDGATRGEYDVIGSLFYDPEMEAHVAYSEPFYFTDVQMVQQVGSGYTYSTVEELTPFSIAVGDGFLYEDEFDRADYLNKVVVTTTEQALQMVAFGRVDLTLDSVDVVNFTKSSFPQSVQDSLEFVPGVLTTQGVHMAVRNSMPNRDQLISDFNQTLGEMRADGRLDAILSIHTEDN